MHKFILRIVLVLALALSGCATTVPVKPYVKANAVRPGRMAILPFENLSNDGGAGYVVDDLLYMTFVQYPSMKIAKPDEVREALKNLKVVSSPKAQHVMELKRLLGVDYVMAGKVHEFVHGDSPVVSLSVRVLDTETGNLVWAINITRKGKDTGDLLGADKVRSVQILAWMVVEEIARSFNSSIVKENGKVPGAYAVIAAVNAISEQGSGKVEGTSAEPRVTEAASPEGATAEVAPVSVPEKKETGEALPAVSPKPAQPATVPVITRAAQADDARGEAAVPLQRTPDLPSSASGEERAPAGAETALPPAEKTAEPAPGEVAALSATPEAPVQPVQPVQPPIGKESAVSVHRPSDLQSPSIGEKKEDASVKRSTLLLPIVKEINGTANGFEIVTDGAVADCKTFALSKPHRLVIDVMGVKRGMARKIPLRGFGMKGARIGVYPGKVRIVLDGGRKIPSYRIEKSDRGVKVIFLERSTKEVKEGYPLPVTGNIPIPAPLPVKASYPVTVSETTVAQDACPEGPVEENNGTAGSLLDLTIHFGTNKSGISSGYYREAGRIAAFLKDNPQAVLSIEGHADYLGSPRYNLVLSRRRADRVKGYLEKSFSIASSRITTKGVGCTRPVADNAIPEGREKNRRAVVRIFASDRKSGRSKVMGKR